MDDKPPRGCLALMVSLRHRKVAGGSNNPNREVSKTAWNDEHALTGTAGTMIVFDAQGEASEVSYDALLARIAALEAGGATTITLGTLTFSSGAFTAGVPASGTIIGATAGSTIDATGLPTGLTINSAARTWAWDGTGSASAGTFTLTETLVGSTNSGRQSFIGYVISAPSTITAPVLTKTSGSGVAPFTFSAQINQDNTFAGYYLHIQTDDVLPSAPPPKNGDGSYVSPVQDFYHQITESERESGDIDLSGDGFTTWTGAGSLHARITRDDGVASSWSNDIGDTITSSVTQWPATNGFNKSNYVTSSGTPKRLTATGTAGLFGAAYIRADHVPSGTTAIVDITLDDIAASGGGIEKFAFSIENGTTDYTAMGGGATQEPGYGDNIGMSVRFQNGGTQSLQTWTGVGFTGGDLVTPAAGLFQNTDKFRIEIDTGAHTLKVWRSRSGGAFTQMGTTKTLPTLSAYYLTYTVFDKQAVTADFTGWA